MSQFDALIVACDPVRRSRFADYSAPRLHLPIRGEPILRRVVRKTYLCSGVSRVVVAGDTTCLTGSGAGAKLVPSTSPVALMIREGLMACETEFVVLVAPDLALLTSEHLSIFLCAAEVAGGEVCSSMVSRSYIGARYSNAPMPSATIMRPNLVLGGVTLADRRKLVARAERWSDWSGTTHEEPEWCRAASAATGLDVRAVRSFPELALRCLRPDDYEFARSVLESPDRASIR